MLNITVDDNDLKKVGVALGRLQKQVPFATALSITKIAKQVRDDEKKAIVRIFKKTTRFTQNSVFMKPAKKSDLSAQVWLKDLPAPRFQHYLEPNIYGGSRPRKGLEKLLNNKGKTSLPFLIPGSGVDRTSNGSVSKGQINKILSSESAQFDRLANSTARSRARGKRRKSRRRNDGYFVIKKTRRGLKPGVYERFQFGFGRAIKPVYVSVTRVSYKKRYDFFGIADQSIQKNSARLIDASIQQAIRTAWK